MGDLFFTGNAGWFTVAAFVGTFFFGLRLILVSIGHGADVSVDLDLDPGHADPTEGFKVLSIQSIAAFLMGFGWAGLGALKGTGLSLGVSLGIGAFGGVAMVWLMAWLLKAVYDLERSGNISPQAAVGKEAQVYSDVPGDDAGYGQIRVTIQGRQRFMRAFSGAEELPTGTRVRVVSVNEDRSVRVVRC